MGERSPALDTARTDAAGDSVTDSLPVDPAVYCDAGGVIRQANTAAAALLRTRTPDELYGRALDELLDGGDQVGWLALADGDRRRVRVIRVPREPCGTVVILLDLGTLDLPADVPAERRHLLQIQRHARMGTWEHDHDTGATSFSPGFLDLLGAWFGTSGRMSSLFKRVHADERHKLVAAWRRHLADGEPVDQELRVVLPDGAIRWAELHARLDDPAQHAGSRRSSGHIRDITERKNTGDALAAERAKLVDAQRLARIGSWTYDALTGQVTRSEVLLEMYAEIGVAPDHDVLFGVHPRDLPAARRMRDTLLNAVDEETIELDVRSVDGIRVYRARGRAELDEDGTVLRVHGTVQDVTEQRQLEGLLAEDRRRFAEAQQVAGLGSWEWIPATNDVFWSEKIHELLGVPPAERSSYLRYLDSVHPEDRRWVDESWQRLAARGGRADLEHRVVRMDGVQRMLRCHAAVVRGEDGPDRVVGTAQDVTEQRAMQSMVARSSRRFADLVSIAPVGIGLFDAEARVLHGNDALCELFGYELEKLRGMTTQQFIHQDEWETHRASIEDIRAFTSDTYSIPQRKMVTAGGRVVHCKLDIRLSVQDDGRRIWIVAFTDITEQRKVAESLRHQATHDELTGLPNRAAVNTLLGELLAGDAAADAAVLFCDIDNFKRVNDSLGHEAGDELLVTLGRRLADGLGEHCTPARLSGDEFVIICSDVAAVGGVPALASTVDALLRRAVPVRGQLVRASASIGAAVPTGEKVTGADLLRFADVAMLESKRRGGGRVSLADTDLIATAERQVHREGELRDALHSDGLELHYQPVVGQDGAVLTAEALLRWPHPSGRTIMPDEFLPIAEQGGLLRELDRWVLRRALGEAARWPVCGAEPVAVAVNLSALVPGEANFVDAVADAIAESGIDPARVVLELVETVLIDLPASGIAAMTELAARGVRFAVDDFGTGYSSLGRLKELPAQVLKVDRSFVAGVADNPADRALSRAVVEIAHALERTCVAEGVETAEQFAALREVGVRAYQGWLFAKALPVNEFRALLHAAPLPVPEENRTR